MVKWMDGRTITTGPQWVLHLRLLANMQKHIFIVTCETQILQKLHNLQKSTQFVNALRHCNVNVKRKLGRTYNVKRTLRSTYTFSLSHVGATGSGLKKMETLPNALSQFAEVNPAQFLPDCVLQIAQI